MVCRRWLVLGVVQCLTAPLLSCTLMVHENNQREELSAEARAVQLDRALANIDALAAFGDRSPGKNQELAATLVTMLEDAGLSDVHIEDFSIPTFAPLSSVASITEGAEERALPHEVSSFAGSGDLDASIFDAGNGRAVHPEAEGQIFLIDALQTASIRVQYDNAVASNAAGIFFNSNVDGGYLRQRHVWRFERKGAITGPIPAVAISKEDATAIRQRLTAGETVTGHLAVESEVGRGTGYNVIGRIPGTEYPDQRIVINAHMDSWFQGIVDDIQSIGALLEIADVFARHPPKYTVEIVAFDVEETALLGSADYLRRRSPDAGAGIAAAMTLEMLAPEAPELTIVSSDPLLRDEPNAPWETVIRDSRSGSLFETQLGASDFMTAFNGEIPLDQKNFWERGIPGFFLVTTYSPFHTSADVLERTDNDRLDAVMRALVDAVRLLQDFPPDDLRRPPASTIRIKPTAPLAPLEGEPLVGEVELQSSMGEPLDGITLVATIYDEPGTTLLDEAVVTPLGAGRYQFEFAPLATTGRHVINVSGVGGMRSGRDWFRVEIP
ncbi:MAG: M28 family peptidase [Deltaproteobacteria bacterium]|nr:M28 family peptidase [Deltaproteobacteria bacterium]